MNYPHLFSFPSQRQRGGERERERGGGREGERGRDSGIEGDGEIERER